MVCMGVSMRAVYRTHPIKHVENTCEHTHAHTHTHTLGKPLTGVHLLRHTTSRPTVSGCKQMLLRRVFIKANSDLHASRSAPSFCFQVLLMSNQMIRSLDEETLRDPVNYNTYRSVFILCSNLSPRVIVSLTKVRGMVWNMLSDLYRTEDDLHDCPFT